MSGLRPKVGDIVYYNGSARRQGGFGDVWVDRREQRIPYLVVLLVPGKRPPYARSESHESFYCVSIEAEPRWRRDEMFARPEDLAVLREATYTDVPQPEAG